MAAAALPRYDTVRVGFRPGQGAILTSFTRSFRLSLAALGPLVLAAPMAQAADFTARQVTEQLYKAQAGTSIDFSGRDLEGLDLAGLGFKKARLSDANLFGADLSGADLSDVDLRSAKLDRIIAIGTRFDRANMAGASLLRPTTTTSFDGTVGEAPSFTGADLTKVRMFGVFAGSSFAGAKMSGVSLAPFNDSGFIEMLWRSKLDSADMSGTDLTGANLAHVSFRFANLKGANLSGAKLKNADLSHADLTGANLTGADISHADLDSANLTGVTGLDSASGLATVRNRDKAIN
jgi:uncharacterized protein YjbI with pentapeptide repeats